MQHISFQDLIALAQIARTVNWSYDPARYVDEAEEDPGRLCVEAHGNTMATREEAGEEFIYEEVFLAVSNGKENFTLRLEGYTTHEAISLVSTMSGLLT